MISNTKGGIINDAYSRLRISGLTVDPTPEDMEIALSRLENMMSTLEARDIRLNYRFEELPDPATEHGVVSAHYDMMATNLATRLAPDFGKPVSNELARSAASSMSDTHSITAANNVRRTEYPNRQPLGSGNRRNYRYLRFNRPQPQAPLYSDVLVKDTVSDFEESYEAYLDSGETITSFEIKTDNGLTLVSSTNNDPLINYRLRAESSSSFTREFLQLSITVTTSTGRIDQRVKDFKIRDQFQPT